MLFVNLLCLIANQRWRRIAADGLCTGPVLCPQISTKLLKANLPQARLLNVGPQIKVEYINSMNCHLPNERRKRCALSNPSTPSASPANISTDTTRGRFHDARLPSLEARTAKETGSRRRKLSLERIVVQIAPSAPWRRRRRYGKQ